MPTIYGTVSSNQKPMVARQVRPGTGVVASQPIPEGGGGYSFGTDEGDTVEIGYPVDQPAEQGEAGG